MLRLLLEKDSTEISSEIKKLLLERLYFAKTEIREDENYTVIFAEPVPKGKKQRKNGKEMLKIIKTVGNTVANYVLFSMTEKYVYKTVKEECIASPYFDASSVAGKITDGIKQELVRSIRSRKKHNWFTVIYRRVLENMLESGIFAVNSFIRFRINDFRSFVEDGAGKIFARLSDEIKYMEFIAQLQSFVDGRRPKLYEMKVRVDETGYTLTDGNNEPVDFSIYEAAKKENADKEDLLIGMLLVAAPVRILVSADDAFFNTNLFSTLSNIFGDRIIVDYARNEN